MQYPSQIFSLIKGSSSKLDNAIHVSFACAAIEATPLSDKCVQLLKQCSRQIIVLLEVSSGMLVNTVHVSLVCAAFETTTQSDNFIAREQQQRRRLSTISRSVSCLPSSRVPPRGGQGWCVPALASPTALRRLATVRRRALVAKLGKILWLNTFSEYFVQLYLAKLIQSDCKMCYSNLPCNALVWEQHREI